MKKIFQLINKGIILLFLTVLSSCDSNMDEAKQVKDIFFPKYPPPVSRYGYVFREAKISGKLELKDNCLDFKGADRSFITLIEWPNYFDLMRIDGVGHIVRDGKVIAKTGDHVSMGGAGSGLRPGTKIQCLPPYWAVGEFTTPSFIESITIRYNIYNRNKMWLKRHKNKPGNGVVSLWFSNN